MAEMCRPTAGPMARFDWTDRGELIKMGLGPWTNHNSSQNFRVYRLEIIVFAKIPNFKYTFVI